MIYLIIGSIIVLKIIVLCSIFGLPKHSLRHLKKLSLKFNGSVSLLGILKGQLNKNYFHIRIRGESVEVSLHTSFFFHRKIALFTQAFGPVLFMRKINVMDLDERRKIHIYSNQQDSKELFYNESFIDNILKLIRYCLYPDQKILKDILTNNNQVTLKIKSKKICISFKYNPIKINSTFINNILDKMYYISFLMEQEEGNHLEGVSMPTRTSITK